MSYVKAQRQRHYEVAGKTKYNGTGKFEEKLWGVVKDIMTANGIPEEFIGNKLFMMGINIVQYGVTLGKRIERQRNKSKYGLSASQRDYMRAILEIVQNNNQSEDSCMIYKLRIAYVKCYE